MLVLLIKPQNLNTAAGIEGDFTTLPAKHRALVEGSHIEIDERTEGARDYNFARWLTTEHGVTPIPPSAFYCDANKSMAYQYARFAFCKDEALLIEAAVRLKRMAGKI
jgi:aspartate/methionine/tyrosine aminotransferase